MTDLSMGHGKRDDALTSAIGEMAAKLEDATKLADANAAEMSRANARFRAISSCLTRSDARLCIETDRQLDTPSGVSDGDAAVRLAHVIEQEVEDLTTHLKLSTPDRERAASDNVEKVSRLLLESRQREAEAQLEIERLKNALSVGQRMVYAADKQETSE
jgi:hypothetical protein